MPRRTPDEKMARTMPPRAVNSLGKLTLPEAALSNSSEVKCWFTAPYTLHARKAAMTKSLIDPDGANAELIVKKLNLNRGHKRPCAEG